MEIEKNIPAPVVFVFDFSQMVGGDSVFFEGETKNTTWDIQREAKNIFKQMGYMLAVQERTENEKHGIRFWCVNHKKVRKNKINKILSLLSGGKEMGKTELFKATGKANIDAELQNLIDTGTIGFRMASPSESTGRPRRIYFLK